MDSGLFAILEEDVINLVRLDNAIFGFGDNRPSINIAILWKHQSAFSDDGLMK